MQKRENHKYEFGVDLPTDPFKIASLIKGTAFQNAVKRVPLDLWGLSESELKSFIQITNVDYALKYALWHEVRHALLFGSKISPLKVYVGICSYTHFYSVIGNPHKLAWMLSPIMQFQELSRLLAEPLLDRARSILELPIVDESGKVNGPVINFILELTVKLQDALASCPTTHR